MATLDTATVAQTIKPSRRGLNPDFNISLKSVLRPTADKAVTIRNLPNEERNTAVDPLITLNVFNREAAKKPKMNHGKVFLMLKFMSLPVFSVLCFFSSVIAAKNKDIGIIIVVRVSFTIVAYCPAALLKAYPAATTEEVSLTAVPAHNPKALSEKPSICPKGGKINTATTLKKKIVDIE